MNADRLTPVLPDDPTPSAEALSAARKTVTAALSPVRPLPSDWTLIAALLGAFVLFPAAITLPIGFLGQKALTVSQAAFYEGAIAVCALIYSVAIVQRMIPGSRRLIPYSWLLLAGPVLVAVVPLTLFPHNIAADFIARGFPCLRLACISAAISGPFIWWFVRHGFAANRASSAITGGLFAGLTGMAVLALHCPIHNASHILAWHCNALILSTIAAYAGSSWLQKVQRR